MNRPSHPPGRPEATESAKNPRPDPYRRALPQPPPPRLGPRFSLPERYGSDNMIPASVRSVPETDRWCLRLLTSMQRGCDTLNPLAAGTVGPAGFCERAGVPLMRPRGSATQRNQRLGTPGGPGDLGGSHRHFEGRYLIEGGPKDACAVVPVHRSGVQVEFYTDVPVYVVGELVQMPGPHADVLEGR